MTNCRRTRWRRHRRWAVAAAAAMAALAILGAASSIPPAASAFAVHLATFVPRCRRIACCPIDWMSSAAEEKGAMLSSLSGETRRLSLVVRRMSSGGGDVGGGLGDRSNPPGGGGGRNGGGGGPLDDFLEESRDNESDGMTRARELISEDSLPISFGYDAKKEGTSEDESSDGVEAEGDYAPATADDIVVEDASVDVTAAAAARGDIVPARGSFAAPKGDEVLALAENPYLEVVSRLSPSDIISKFTTTAHPRVQDAVRTTILGLIGNLPKLGFDAATVTTGERLANLMFQLQMTGYMFKNAEYRLSLTQSLGMVRPPGAYGDMAKNGFILEGDQVPLEEENPVDRDDLEDEEALSRGKVKGKIRVRYGRKVEKGDGEERKASEGDGDDDEGGGSDDDASSVDPLSSGAMEVEVDAEAYLSELRSEVSRFRDELTVARKTKEDALRKDLLLYIRTMSQDELRGLTGTMSQDVLAAMKGLVNVVMAGIGEGMIKPETVTEQSGEAMAQLCMWQLVVGYNLRELEVREEMRAALKGGKDDGEEAGSGFQ